MIFVRHRRAYQIGLALPVETQMVELRTSTGKHSDAPERKRRSNTAPNSCAEGGQAATSISSAGSEYRFVGALVTS